jgi:hypothetical protein
MQDLPLQPELYVRNGEERTLRSIADARAYVRELVKVRSFPPWVAMLRRLEAVETEEDALEAAGALRELLTAEKLLVAAAGR